ncbi:DUF2239 family protein [Paenalcaligenes sp. Me52]|uniref:DUF2239 family protein n=1 Tax=Paenalcaligenes sp. Me52 TaxID=3392038 RepID=UPI003D2CA095
MSHAHTSTYTSFDGHRRLATGSLADNALAIKHALEQGTHHAVLLFDDATGRTVEVDTRGSDDDILARLATTTTATTASPVDPANDTAPRGRGRPKLGVVPREVTLLPRHWEWLSQQPGGASVTLRKLVEDARRSNSDKDKTRKAHERAYHFMVAIAGNLPGYEEATRALFANDADALQTQISSWPEDVQAHTMKLAFGTAHS